MSRYFKYKTAADLARDAGGRGLDVRLSDDLSILTRPIEVAGRRVGNRLAIHPMEGCDGTPEGDPDDLTIRRYARFGDGGAKLVWGEAAAVVPEGRANTRQLVVSEARAAGLSRLLKTCRDAHRAALGDDGDLLVGLQLTHSGRYSVPRPILGQHDPLLDGRTFLDRKAGIRVSGETPLISDDELDRLQDRYIDAAGVAFQVGFDFVDVKAVPSLPDQRAPERRNEARPVRRALREPDPVPPRGRRQDPGPIPGSNRRHPLECV